MLKPCDRELLFRAMNGDLLELEQIADVDALLAELSKLSPAAVASLLAESAAAKFCDGSDPALADVMALIPDEYRKLLEGKYLWNCADLLVEVIPSDEGVFLQIIGFGVCVEAPNVEIAAEEAIDPQPVHPGSRPLDRSGRRPGGLAEALPCWPPRRLVR